MISKEKLQELEISDELAKKFEEAMLEEAKIEDENEALAYKDNFCASLSKEDLAKFISYLFAIIENDLSKDLN